MAVKKNYKKDPALKREWLIEYFGPPWEDIVWGCFDPLYTSGYVAKEFDRLSKDRIFNWHKLESRLTRQGYSDVNRYDYPKSLRQCLQIIRNQKGWHNLVQFRLVNLEDGRDIIPYELLAS